MNVIDVDSWTTDQKNEGDKDMTEEKSKVAAKLQASFDKATDIVVKAAHMAKDNAVSSAKLLWQGINFFAACMVRAAQLGLIAGFSVLDLLGHYIRMFRDFINKKFNKQEGNAAEKHITQLVLAV